LRARSRLTIHLTAASAAAYCVAEFLRHGTDAAAVDELGRNALSFAAPMGSPGVQDACSLLTASRPEIRNQALGAARLAGGPERPAERKSSGDRRVQPASHAAAAGAK